MEVILLQRIGRLGQMGDVVTVKDGYARNYLLPQKKALRATEENRARFETQRAQLEANNLELKKEAEAVAEKLAGKVFVAIRSAGDTGQLYGSVSTRDISDVVTAGGFTIERRQVIMDRPIKNSRPARDECRAAPRGRRPRDAQRGPLRGRSRAPIARRGRDGRQGGEARARDLQPRDVRGRRRPCGRARDGRGRARLTRPMLRDVARFGAPSEFRPRCA